MSKKKKLDYKDIYDFAMITEEDAETLYALLSEIASEDYLKDIFSQMARKEKKQHDSFLKLKAKAVRKEAKEENYLQSPDLEKEKEDEDEMNEEELARLNEQFGAISLLDNENEELSEKVFGQANVLDDFKKIEDLEETMDLFIKYKLKTILRLHKLLQSLCPQDQNKLEVVINEEKRSLKELLEMRSTFLNILKS